MASGNGVIWDWIPFETLVIPAKAGIQSVRGARGEALCDPATDRVMHGLLKLRCGQLGKNVTGTEHLLALIIGLPQFRFSMLRLRPLPNRE
ncbi:MAG: hypothetical protein ABSB82_18195 [Terriglobia bacterium]